MKTQDKRLKAVDVEYAEARKEYESARKRLDAAAAARTAAHLAVEYERSAEGQRLASMTDDEWAAFKQRVEVSRGPKVEPVVNAPGAE